MKVVDGTKGPLLGKIWSLAWPSVLQSILSNCYAMNDFLFVGRMEDKTLAATCVAAISSTVGLQIIAFAFHNIIPGGANAYTAQYKGAAISSGVSSTFRAGVYASLVCSSLLSLLGYLFVGRIIAATNSTRSVSAEAEDYFRILLASSPAFGLLLMIHGFYKSNGDVRTPLVLEFFSLLLNTAGNYLFVLHFDWGIKGAAYVFILLYVYTLSFLFVYLFLFLVFTHTYLLSHSINHFHHPQIRLCFVSTAASTVGLPHVTTRSSGNTSHTQSGKQGSMAGNHHHSTEAGQARCVRVNE